MAKPKIWLKSGAYNFAGYNYLGLAKEKRILDAMYQTALEYGISPTSSRWGIGWNQVFEDLEMALKKHFETEDATIVSTAFLVGSIYFGSMSQDHDTVYCDETSHVNLFKGMALANMKVVKYRHLDTQHLRELISKHQGRQPIIATDGLWGVSGDIPPLKEINEIAKEFHAELFIDDAHGAFALGKTGKGTAEHCGLRPGDATIMGSLSKALGCNGGFIVGREELVDRFRRNDITSGSNTSAIPMAGACLKALEIVKAEPQRRDQMFENGSRMRKVLLQKGFTTADPISPVLGICLKDEFEAMRFSEHLAKFGVMIPYFKYASEPRHNLLRGATRSNFTEEELATFEKAVLSF